ncbi:MAG: serine hydrolase, partial [Candidatus Dormibacteraeota bacterium]|nr:serine hydrolase [Candidatus Dormibacteraeota bacterium]
MIATALPRSRPSDQQVDAQGLLDFLDGVERTGIDLHSLVVVRHGAVVAEGWWEPYRPEGVHLLYSLSKSFTSTAVGMAQAEGLLSVDDLVLDHFPDEAPARPSANLRAMRLRHLLSMASGHEEDTGGRVMAGAPDLVRTFLALRPEHEPGTVFTYNQGCTHTLAVLVSRLSGLSLLDYLRPRLLDPLGIDQALWTLAPDGVEQGFSGLHATTESVAKLGQLYLQRGRWDGTQLVPEGYVEEATRKQVDNRDRMNENPDWQQGYGFQFWRCRGDAFRGDGAFGQLCVVMPGRDAVVACTAQTADMQGELDLIWKHVLPALRDDVRADAGAEERLAERLGHLATARVEGAGAGPGQAVVFEPRGRTEGLRTVRAEPVADGIRLSIAHAEGTTEVVARPGVWTEAELPGMRSLHSPVAVSAAWEGDRTLRAD